MEDVPDMQDFHILWHSVRTFMPDSVFYDDLLNDLLVAHYNLVREITKGVEG